MVPDQNQIIYYDQTYYTSNTTSTGTSTSGTFDYLYHGGTGAVDSYQRNLPQIPQKNKKLQKGEDFILTMPDGSKVEVKVDGSFKVIDSDAKVTYEANRFRGFNKYINASDLLEEFIVFIGQHGAKQENALRIPIEYFINWLIYRAAEEDGESIEPDAPKKVIQPLALPAPERYNKRCRWCGRFLPKKLVNIGINFCNDIHFSKKLLTI